MLIVAALAAVSAALAAAWPRILSGAARARREALRLDRLDRLLRPRSRSGWRWG